MKKRINNWLFSLLLKRIAKTIVYSENKLTRGYLESKGWIPKFDSNLQKTFWFEEGLKERDTIWIDFETNSYRIWHGKDKTYITSATSIEYFEIYYLMAHGDNGRYELAGV